MIAAIRHAILHHELWVLRTARGFPLGATFFAMSLPIAWRICLLPALVPFGFFLEWVYETSTSTVAFWVAILLNLVVGIGFLVVLAPWFFRWYFIGAGLMFGRTFMADRKEAQILERLGTINA